MWLRGNGGVPVEDSVAVREYDFPSGCGEQRSECLRVSHEVPRSAHRNGEVRGKEAVRENVPQSVLSLPGWRVLPKASFSTLWRG